MNGILERMIKWVGEEVEDYASRYSRLMRCPLTLKQRKMEVQEVRRQAFKWVAGEYQEISVSRAVAVRAFDSLDDVRTDVVARMNIYGIPAKVALSEAIEYCSREGKMQQLYARLVEVLAAAKAMNDAGYNWERAEVVYAVCRAQVATGIDETLGELVEAFYYHRLSFFSEVVEPQLPSVEQKWWSVGQQREPLVFPIKNYNVPVPTYDQFQVALRDLEEEEEWRHRHPSLEPANQLECRKQANLKKFLVDKEAARERRQQKRQRKKQLMEVKLAQQERQIEQAKKEAAWLEASFRKGSVAKKEAAKRLEKKLEQQVAWVLGNRVEQDEAFEASKSSPSMLQSIRRKFRMIKAKEMFGKHFQMDHVLKERMFDRDEQVCTQVLCRVLAYPIAFRQALCEVRQKAVTEQRLEKLREELSDILGVVYSFSKLDDDWGKADLIELMHGYVVFDTQYPVAHFVLGLEEVYKSLFKDWEIKNSQLNDVVRRRPGKRLRNPQKYVRHVRTDMRQVLLAQARRRIYFAKQGVRTQKKIAEIEKLSAKIEVLIGEEFDFPKVRACLKKNKLALAKKPTEKKVSWLVECAEESRFSVLSTLIEEKVVSDYVWPKRIRQVRQPKVPKFFKKVKRSLPDWCTSVVEGVDCQWLPWIKSTEKVERVRIVEERDIIRRIEKYYGMTPQPGLTQDQLVAMYSELHNNTKQRYLQILYELKQNRTKQSLSRTELWFKKKNVYYQETLDAIEASICRTEKPGVDWTMDMVEEKFPNCTVYRNKDDVQRADRWSITKEDGTSFKVSVWRGTLIYPTHAVSYDLSHGDISISKPLQLGAITDMVVIGDEVLAVQRVEDRTSFVSERRYVSGTPIYNTSGDLCSIVTQKKEDKLGYQYAILRRGEAINEGWEFTISFSKLAVFSVATSAAINCGWKMEGSRVDSDCVSGTLENKTFIGYYNCTCKGSNKWTHLDAGCPKYRQPKRHIVGRQFGGPRHGYNCWFNDDETEVKWTKNETAIALAVNSGEKCAVYANTWDKKLQYNCSKKYVELSENFAYHVKGGDIVVWPKEQQEPAVWAWHTIIDGEKFDVGCNVTLSTVSDIVYVGKPDGQEAVVKDLGKFRVFESSTWLVSGTPIYNKLGRLCSVVTCAKGNLYYLLQERQPKPKGSEIKNHSTTIKLEEGYDRVSLKGKIWVEKTEQGKPCQVLMHGPLNDASLSKTYHHYPDFFSSQILCRDLSRSIYIGHPSDGPSRPVNRINRLLTYGFDGEKFHYQVAYSFWYNDNLLSGTPLFNDKKQLISVVTSSRGEHYSIAGHYGNRGRILCKTVEKKMLPAGLIYAGESFFTKEDLLRYIEKPDETRDGILYVVEICEELASRLIYVEKGIEKIHLYVDHPVVTKFHAGRWKPMFDLRDQMNQLTVAQVNTNRRVNSIEHQMKEMTQFLKGCGYEKRPLRSQSLDQGPRRTNSRNRAASQDRQPQRPLDKVDGQGQAKRPSRSRGRNFRGGQQKGQVRDVSASTSGQQEQVVNQAVRRKSTGNRVRGGNRVFTNSNRWQQRAESGNRSDSGISENRSHSSSRTRNAMDMCRDITLEVFNTAAGALGLKADPKVKKDNFTVWTYIYLLLTANINYIYAILVKRVEDLRRKVALLDNGAQRLIDSSASIYYHDHLLNKKLEEWSKGVNGVLADIGVDSINTTISVQLNQTSEEVHKIVYRVSGAINRRKRLIKTLDEIDSSLDDCTFNIDEVSKKLSQVKKNHEDVVQLFRQRSRFIRSNTESVAQRIYRLEQTVNLLIQATEGLVATSVAEIVYADSLTEYGVMAAVATTAKVPNVVDVVQPKISREPRHIIGTGRTVAEEWHLGSRDSESSCTKLEVALNAVVDVESVCSQTASEKYLGTSNASCSLAYTNIVEQGQHYIAEAKNVERKKRCSLVCLNVETLFELMEKQPITWSCLSPILTIIAEITELKWEESKEASSLLVFNDVVRLSLSENKKVELQLKTKPPIRRCVMYGYKSSNEEGVVTYMDGIFVCKIPITNTDQRVTSVLKWLVENMRATKILNTLISVIATSYVVKHVNMLAGVVTLTFLIYITPVVGEECMEGDRFSVILEPVGKDASDYIFDSRIEVRQGQCVNVGAQRRVLFKDMTSRYIGYFVAAYPGNTNIACLKWDYNCPGTQNSVCVKDLGCKSQKNGSNIYFDFCGGQKTVYDSACLRSGSMNTKVEAIVSLPTHTSQYIYVFEMSANPVEQVLTVLDTVMDVSTVEKVVVGEDTKSEGKLIFHTFIPGQVDSWKYLARYQNKWWCARTAPVIDRCFSTKAMEPWAVVSKLACKPQFLWTDTGYVAERETALFAQLIDKFFVTCPEDLSIEDNLVSIKISEPIKKGYVWMTTKTKISSILTKSCSSVEIESNTIEKGFSGYYKISVVTIRGRVNTRCSIVVEYPGCIVRGPITNVVEENFQLVQDVLCGFKISDTAYILLKSGVRQPFKLSASLTRDLDFSVEANIQHLTAQILSHNMSIFEDVAGFFGSPFSWLMQIFDFVKVFKFGAMAMLAYIAFNAITFGNYIVAGLAAAAIGYIWGVPFGVDAFELQPELTTVCVNTYRLFNEIGVQSLIPDECYCREIVDGLIDVGMIVGGMSAGYLYVDASTFFTMFIVMFYLINLDRNPIEALALFWRYPRIPILRALHRNRFASYQLCRFIPNMTWGKRPLATVQPVPSIKRQPTESLFMFNDVQKKLDIAQLEDLLTYSNDKDAGELTYIRVGDHWVTLVHCGKGVPNAVVVTWHQVNNTELKELAMTVWDGVVILKKNKAEQSIRGISDVLVDFEIIHDPDDQQEYVTTLNLGPHVHEFTLGVERDGEMNLVTMLKHSIDGEVQPSNSWVGFSGLVIKADFGVFLVSTGPEVDVVRAPDSMWVYPSTCDRGVEFDTYKNNWQPQQKLSTGVIALVLDEFTYNKRTVDVLVKKGFSFTVPTESFYNNGAFRDVETVIKKRYVNIVSAELKFDIDSFEDVVKAQTFTNFCIMCDSAEVEDFNNVLYRGMLYEYVSQAVPDEKRPTTAPTKVGDEGSLRETMKYVIGERQNMFVTELTGGLFADVVALLADDFSAQGKPLRTNIRMRMLVPNLLPDYYLFVERRKEGDVVLDGTKLVCVRFTQIASFLAALPKYDRVFCLHLKTKQELLELISAVNNVITFSVNQPGVLYLECGEALAANEINLVNSMDYQDADLPWPVNGDIWRTLETTSTSPVIISGTMATGDVEKQVGELDGREIPIFCQKGKFASVQLSDGIQTGRATVVDGTLCTNYHVTKGVKVVYTASNSFLKAEESTSVTWKKADLLDKEHDVVAYGGLEFSQPQEGHLYAVPDCLNNKTLWLLCRNAAANVADLGIFASYLPVNVDFGAQRISKLKLGRMSGFSGSGIINHEGKLVGVYGMTVRVNRHSDAYVCSLPASVEFDYGEYFKKCAIEMNMRDVPEDKHFFVLIAPTGTGKTTRFSLSVLELIEVGETVVLLEPTVAAATCAYDNFKVHVKEGKLEGTYTISLQVGERNVNSSMEYGNGSRTLKVMTAGKFIANLNALTSSVRYILVDEAHKRSDPTIVYSQLLLSNKDVFRRASNSRPRICYLTATDIEFGTWGAFLGSSQIPTTRYPIREEVMTPAASEKPIADTILIDLKRLATDPRWHHSYRFPRDRFVEGRVIIFVHSVRACEDIKAQISKQAPELYVVAYYAQCKIALHTLPDQCVIVSTDVLGVSVTVGNCRGVIDLGLENRPEIRLDLDKESAGYSYRNDLKPKRVTQQTADQRKGRTGRTCSGFYYFMQGDMLKEVMWEPTVMYQVYLEVMKNNRDLSELERWGLSLEYKEAYALFSEMAELHFSRNIMDASNAFERLKLACEADGDQLALYLKSTISKEWLDRQMSSVEGDLIHHHKRTVKDNTEWANKYFNTFKVHYDTEEQAMAAATKSKRLVYSMFNDVPDSDWTRLIDARLMSYDASMCNRFLQKMKKVNQATLTPTSILLAEASVSSGREDSRAVFIPSDESEVEQDSYWYLAIVGVLVLGNAALTGLVARYGNKYIIKTASLPKAALAEYARHNEPFGDKYCETLNFFELLWTRIKNVARRCWRNIKQLFAKLFSKKQAPDVTVDSANDAEALLDSCKDFFYQHVPWLMNITTGVGATIGAVCGFTVDDFVKTFGIAFGGLTFMIVSAATTSLLGLVPGAAVYISALVTYLLTRSHITSKDEFHNPYAGKCGKMIAGTGFSGLVLGTFLKDELRALFGKIRDVAQVPEISQSAPILAVNPYRPQPSVVCASKHLYMVLVKLFVGELTIKEGIAGLAQVAVSVYHCNWANMLYILLGTTLLIAGRVGICMWRTSSIKEMGGTKSLKEGYEDWKTALKDIPSWYDHFVSVLSIIAKPTSIISLVLVYLDMYACGQEFNEKTITHVFHTYSGTSVFVTLISWLFTTCVRVFDSRIEQNSLTWWETIKNALAKFMELDIFSKVSIWRDSCLTKIFGLFKSRAEGFKEKHASKYVANQMPNIDAFSDNLREDLKEAGISLNAAQLADLNSKNYVELIKSLGRKHFEKTILRNIVDGLSQDEKNEVVDDYLILLEAYGNQEGSKGQKSIIRWIYEKIVFFFKKIWDWIKMAYHWVKDKLSEMYGCVTKGIEDLSIRAGESFRKGLNIPFLGGRDKKGKVDLSKSIPTCDWSSNYVVTTVPVHEQIRVAFKTLMDYPGPGARMLSEMMYFAQNPELVSGTDALVDVDISSLIGDTIYFRVQSALGSFMIRQNRNGLDAILGYLGAVQYKEGVHCLVLKGATFEINFNISWDAEKTILNIWTLGNYVQCYIVDTSVGSEWHCIIVSDIGKDRILERIKDPAFVNQKLVLSTHCEHVTKKTVLSRVPDYGFLGQVIRGKMARTGLNKVWKLVGNIGHAFSSSLLLKNILYASSRSKEVDDAIRQYGPRERKNIASNVPKLYEIVYSGDIKEEISKLAKVSAEYSPKQIIGFVEVDIDLVERFCQTMLDMKKRMVALEGLKDKHLICVPFLRSQDMRLRICPEVVTEHPFPSGEKPRLNTEVEKFLDRILEWSDRTGINVLLYDGVKVCSSPTVGFCGCSIVYFTDSHSIVPFMHPCHRIKQCDAATFSDNLTAEQLKQLLETPKKKGKPQGLPQQKYSGELFHASGNEQQCALHCLYLSNDTGKVKAHFEGWRKYLLQHYEDFDIHEMYGQQLLAELKDGNNYGLATLAYICHILKFRLTVHVEWEGKLLDFIEVGNSHVELVYRGSHWDRVVGPGKDVSLFSCEVPGQIKDDEPQRPTNLEELEEVEKKEDSLLLLSALGYFTKWDPKKFWSTLLLISAALAMVQCSVALVYLARRPREVNQDSAWLFVGHEIDPDEIACNAFKDIEAVEWYTKSKAERKPRIMLPEKRDGLHEREKRRLAEVEKPLIERNGKSFFGSLFGTVSSGLSDAKEQLSTYVGRYVEEHDVASLLAKKAQDVLLSAIDFSNTDMEALEQEAFDEKEAKSQERGLTYVIGFSNLSTKDKSKEFWHPTYNTNTTRKKILDMSVNHEEYVRAWNLMKTEEGRLPSYEVERVKYSERYKPPYASNLSDNNIYASKSAVKWQLLKEDLPAIFQHAQILWDPACGAGGFEQFLSYLGTLKGEPKRTVFYSTLCQPGHAWPSVESITVKGSLNKLVSLIEPGDDNDLRRKSTIARFASTERPDFIILDCAEGDNSLDVAKNWHLSRLKNPLPKIPGKKSFNKFVDEYTTGVVEFFASELHEEQGDIFKDIRGMLIHCVSQDWKCSAGFAKELSDRYPYRHHIFYRVSDDFCIYSLVTKKTYSDKPTYSSVFEKMEMAFSRAKLLKMDIITPCLACGLDGKNWGVIRSMLMYFSYRYEVRVTVIDKALYKHEASKAEQLCYIDAFFEYFKYLKQGGVAVVRQSGVHRTSLKLIQKLSFSFNKLYAWRSPACPNTSPEWYLVMAGFDAGRNQAHSFEALSEVLVPVRKALMEIFEHALVTLRHPFRYVDTSLQKEDWFEPVVGGVYVYQNRVKATENEPAEFQLEIHESPLGVRCDAKTVSFKNIDAEVESQFVRDNVYSIRFRWKANFSERLSIVSAYANRYRHKGKFRIRPFGKQWRELYNLGTYSPGASKFDNRRRYIVNGYISDGLKETFGIEVPCAAYGFTQHTEAFTVKSYETRLDRNPGLPDKRYLLEYLKALSLMKTEYGKRISGSCRPLNEEEVLKMMRNKGATGQLDPTGSLLQFCQTFPSWYDWAWSDRIIPWMKGDNTSAYFTMRNKRESKLRTDVNAKTGRLQYVRGELTREQLTEAGDMVPRQITFSDSLTRLAQYILLGDLVFKHGANKVYFGSITGTPPQYQGRILKYLWEMQSGGCKNFQYDFERDLYGQIDPEWLASRQGKVARGLVLDFSKFDFTQTLTDRLGESMFMAGFYASPDVSKAIVGMGRDFGFSIVVNDFGDVVGKQGMRASGEFPTSFGNTLQANAHLMVSMSRCLNRPLDELMTPMGSLITYVGGGSGPSNTSKEYIFEESRRELNVLSRGIKNYKVFKKLELLPISLLCDGDDCIIIGSQEDIKQIQRKICTEIEFGKKVLRSGDKAGVEWIQSFEQLSFCSHQYREVRISDKQYFLSTRAPCLSLGKMPMTLKVNTRAFNPSDKEATSVTRGKLLSYLLLYPHIRSVRSFCIIALAALGGGAFNIDNEWKFQEVPIDLTSVASALGSLYGVKSLDDISYIEYDEEVVSLKDLRYNASLVGNTTPIRFNDLRVRAFRWALSVGRLDKKTLMLDTATLAVYKKVFDF